MQPLLVNVKIHKYLENYNTKNLYPSIFPTQSNPWFEALKKKNEQTLTETWEPKFQRQV